MSLISVFEGEGSGVPTAVADVDDLGAPSPTVRFENGYVVVTIFPLDEFTTADVLRAETGRIRFNLPLLTASFTDREAELQALHEALASSDRAVITQAITGLGGVGKTQLAARFVSGYADEFDLVAWIRAEDGGTADLAALAARLGTRVDERSPSEQAQLALDALSNRQSTWLLVLDNVQSPAMLERLLPKGGNGRVLVTTRDRSLSQFARTLTLHVFDEHTATVFLIAHADRPGEDEHARALARALGCLPLALAHAATYCRGGTSFAEYLILLQELPGAELFDDSPERSHARTVSSTWKVSLEGACAASPLAADVLGMAAYMAPDNIPRRLFEILVEDASARSRKRLSDALNALARFSLAVVDDDTVSVHRLVQKIVRDDAGSRDDGRLAARSTHYPPRSPPM